MMRQTRLSIPAIAVVFLSFSCNQALSPEQQKVVGTWILVKPSDHGSVRREIVFHADGFTFTTTCQSAYDGAVANATGEGKWKIKDGMVQVKWLEKQSVGEHTQEIEYQMPLRIDATKGKESLINLANLDEYKRK
jgi:hypothetical protein